ncbi:hypothetical protein [Actinomyces sp. Marseille-P3109]|uniref:hypothetical protein n=1 Tax=Actinomyces sp. Marseille-P3109 TaxID=2083009 RepID=UPI00131F3360|nr:hypothetical protein [Actinomyces sp. Marseille-P3109]
MCAADSTYPVNDYDSSTLDLSALQDIACSVAAVLKQHHIPYNGYVDETQREVEKRQAEFDRLEYNESARTRIRPNFLRTMFGLPGGSLPRKEELPHIGYWTLVEIKAHTMGQRRQYIDWLDKTRLESLDANFVTRYVLLADGSLWYFDAREHRRRDLDIVFDAAASGRWEWMSEEEILLLDHEVRPGKVDEPYNTVTEEYWHSEWESLSTDNDLIVAEKGGGCKKYFNQLLARARKSVAVRSAWVRSSNEESRRYVLTAEQLRHGCRIEHTFENGRSASVRIPPRTKPGKIIPAYDGVSGKVELIRIGVE